MNRLTVNVPVNDFPLAAVPVIGVDSAPAGAADFFFAAAAPATVGAPRSPAHTNALSAASASIRTFTRRTPLCNGTGAERPAGCNREGGFPGPHDLHVPAHRLRTAAFRRVR